MTELRMAQRFTLQATLEEGKLGALHLGHDAELDAPALVLVTSAKVQTGDDVLEAILADGRLLSGCPDVLVTYAAGRDGDQAWLASEAVPGGLAGQVLERRDRLEMPQLLQLGLALGRAVEAMTLAGVRHLDLGPHRVWLDGGALGAGAVRVFGPGWWRLLPAYANGAAADAFYGQAEFLPAEICKGLSAGASADVYSAALVVWALAAAKPPFTSSQPLMTLKRQAVEKPLRLDLVKPALKGVKDLQSVLGDALEKDPARRPAAALWLAALEAAARQWAPETLLEPGRPPAGRNRLAGGQAVAPASGAPQPAAQAAAAPPPAAPEPVAAAPAPTPVSAAQVAEPAPSVAAESASAAVHPAVVVAAPATAQAAGTPWRSEAGDRPAADATLKMSSALVAEAIQRANAAAGTEAATRLTQAVADGDDEGEDDADDAPAAGQDRKGKGKRGKKNRRGDRATIAPAAPAAASAAPAVEARKAELAAAAPAGYDRTQPFAAISVPGSAAAAAAVSKPAAPQVDVRPATGGARISPKRPMTDRTLRAEIAESVFFDDQAAAIEREIQEHSPPTPGPARVGKGVIAAIVLFVLAMVGVAAWMLFSVPDSPPVVPNPDEAAAALDPAQGAVAAAPAPVEAEPTVAPEPPPLAPAAAAVVEVDAMAAADPAVAEAGDALAALYDTGATAAAPVAAEPQPVGEAQAAEVRRLVDEGTALLASNPAEALGKAEAALAINAGHAPADRLKLEARSTLERQQADRQRAEQAAAEKAAAEQAAAAKAAADKAEADRQAAAQQAAADQARAAKTSSAKEAAQRAAAEKAEKAAAAKAAAQQAAAQKAEKAAAAKAAAQQAAAQKAEKAAAAKAAAEKAEANKASVAKAAAEKSAVAKSAAEKAAAGKAAAAQAAADKAAAAKVVAARPAEKPADKPADRPPAADKPASDEGTPAQQEASKMAALAQKANKAKLKVLYLQKAVKLDPGNATYRNLLKSAESELAAETAP